MGVPSSIAAYHQSRKPLVCELDVQPWLCEFWPEFELNQYNADYEVQVNAPGYFGFASSGGGEIYALSPSGKVVCLAFIGMSPQEELLVAETWVAFEGMLRDAL